MGLFAEHVPFPCDLGSGAGISSYMGSTMITFLLWDLEPIGVSVYFSVKWGQSVSHDHCESRRDQDSIPPTLVPPQ